MIQTFLRKKKMFRAVVVASLISVCIPGITATLAPCGGMEMLHDAARREIVAYGQLLRRSILNENDTDGDKQKLADVFFNAFTFTANSTWEIFEDDCTTFVTTGDIPQMWLRDSSVQMMTYANNSPRLPAFTRVLESVITRQVRFFLGDPYGSAFYKSSGPNAGPNRNECPPSDFCPDCSCVACSPQCSAWTYQHDYELDSPLFMFLLQWTFWQSSPKRASAFLSGNEEVKQSVFVLVALMRTEQNHFSESDYYYKPLPAKFAENTGMVWSFARPSDDQTELGYNLPQNLMAASVLSKLLVMNDALWFDSELAQALSTLKTEIEAGIKTYGVVAVSSGNLTKTMFVFETDGWGNSTAPVLDDANMPNLLWLPYLNFTDDAGFADIYENTRQVVLSSLNLNWMENQTNPLAANQKGVAGLGSQHESLGLRNQWPGVECAEQCVWHLSLVMQGLTAVDREEKQRLLDLVLDTAWHGLMHEGFSVVNTSHYNRDFFGWANALFSEWAITDFIPQDAFT